MNNVTMIGRITKDLEPRSTGDGKTVLSFPIAVNRLTKNETGYEADFFNCTCFGQTADYLNQYGGKGLRVSIIGRIQNRSWIDKDGAKRTSTEIVCSSVSVLDRKDAQSQPASKSVPETKVDYDPFGDE